MGRRSGAAQNPRDLAVAIEARVSAGTGSPVDPDGDPVDPDGDLAGRAPPGDLFQQQVNGVTWSTVALRSTRCSATVFEQVVFEDVVFRDCELSGVAFVGCSFRGCVIIGGKAGSILSFSDCALLDLAVVDLAAERVEIHGGTLRSVSIDETAIERLSLHQIRQPRRVRGRLRLSQVGLGSVGGLTELPAAGIDVEVDEGLWGLLGDLTLRRLGVSRIDRADTGV